MPINVTTAGLLPPAVAEQFSMKLLVRRNPTLMHNFAATKYDMRGRSGNEVVMRRFDNIEENTTPLGDSGVTPPPVLLSAADKKAKIQFYGRWMLINEQVPLTNESPILNEAASVLGQCLRESEDALTRNMLAAIPSVIACTGGIIGDNPTEITRTDVDKVVSTLINNDGHSFMESIEGADKFGTGPIPNSFIGMCSAKLVTDLSRMDGFLLKSQYPNYNSNMDAEYGSCSQIRFLVSSKGSVVPASSDQGRDVYNVFVAAKDAYGIIDLDNYPPKFEYKPAFYNDPLSQNAIVNAKWAGARLVTQELWIVKLQATLGVA